MMAGASNGSARLVRALCGVSGGTPPNAMRWRCMTTPLHRALTASVSILGHPAMLPVIVVAALIWRQVEPDSFDLHAVATLVAVAMTVLIQRGQNRDTAALQAKLDELILATEGARNALVGLDQKSVDDIEEIKQGGRAE